MGQLYDDLRDPGTHLRDITLLEEHAPAYLRSPSTR
ncbi:hypothetical protein DFJ69_0110 [Thermomonospora umbrina]|uniref:Uncharacterized protein n=1 Tax=Thermomonospora umbrina TaxID=111806 RepID=A0A3D9SFS5_9ACTN|nr:hypothetical protein DFJ69_0110 [Thermomonospora umbrina]